MSILGERLKEQREKRGWTKTYVARKLGFKGVSTYANWEYGIRDPDTETLAKIADIFDVTTDHLLGKEQKATSKQDQLSSIDFYIKEAKEKYGDNVEVERMKVVREILENIIDLPEEDQRRINDFAERLKK